MPSLFHLMMGLGGTALVVGVMTLWLHTPQQPPLDTALTSSPKKIVGNSALSHGGPSSNSSMAAGLSPVQFQMGQKLIIAGADNISQTITLLSLPPDLATSSSPVAETRIVSPGTVVFISGMRTIEPVPGHTEQYYEVTIPDGGKGWLSERVLRPAMIADTN
jgi:hypothetical protein